MNLTKLFEIQRKLDDHIERKHPPKEGEDRLAKKILALKVELGELANELPEVFKFWSNKKNNYEKALEELVDCLHFILSIGLGLGITEIAVDSDYTEETATDTFIELFNSVSGLVMDLRNFPEFAKQSYEILFNTFIGLGEKHLGFTWKQIEQAYFKKNEINHQRQASDY